VLRVVMTVVVGDAFDVHLESDLDPALPSYCVILDVEQICVTARFRIGLVPGEFASVVAQVG